MRHDPCEEKCIDFYKMEDRLRAADQVMMQIDDFVMRGLLNSRSGIADARLLYGDPHKYEFTDEKEDGVFESKTPSE